MGTTTQDKINAMAKEAQKMFEAEKERILSVLMEAANALDDDEQNSDEKKRDKDTSPKVTLDDLIADLEKDVKRLGNAQIGRSDEAYEAINILFASARNDSSDCVAVEYSVDMDTAGLLAVLSRAVALSICESICSVGVNASTDVDGITCMVAKAISKIMLKCGFENMMKEWMGA